MRQNSYSRKQAEFYDQHPVLVPWAKILVKKGLKWVYKPRELFWKKELDKLGIKQADKLLEVGCGRGEWLMRIKKEHRVKITGLDVSNESIKEAKKWGIGKWVLGEAQNLPFKDNQFEVVISFDTMEHVKAQQKMVQEMVRVLKPKGKILIYTLNKFDKWSLDWCWEKLGIDIYSRAAHKRELFVDSQWLKKELVKNNIQVNSLTYFDGFCTLFWDELIMIKMLFFKKLGLTRFKFLGRLVLGGLNFWVRLIYPLINLMDSWWYKKGQTLSFSILGQKK